MLVRLGSTVPRSVASGRFQIVEKLGSGCFGEVYRGVDAAGGLEVAVKFEPRKSSRPQELQLAHEAQVLELLSCSPETQGFARFLYSGEEGSCRCLVMERLGKNIEDRLQACRGVFNARTTVLVAEQVLRSIEYLHSRGIVHRDIKPENFMFGLREKQHHIHLIDFGLSKVYFAKKHVAMSTRSLTGTVRYASVNTHNRMEQSRRDDLEAIGYMLAYFLRGVLPWSGLNARTLEEKCELIKRRKMKTPLPELCQGFPVAFQEYLAYCRMLGFTARPDYAWLMELFAKTRAQLSELEGRDIKDHDFQWNEGRDLGTLLPLQHWTEQRQPDDAPASRKAFRWGFACGRGSRMAAEPEPLRAIASA
mmetsp:Transcript_109602/g.353800  ORF Transcript_109602/g.353800 Transcript_109602/m.353800 type:complete len:363 (-) Transcript_109602:40-1128(-)